VVYILDPHSLRTKISGYAPDTRRVCGSAAGLVRQNSIISAGRPSICPGGGRRAKDAVVSTLDAGH